MLKKEMERITEKINIAEQNLDASNYTLENLNDIILIYENVFDQLKTFIHGYQFESEKEEIEFFKKTKPELFSKLIYYKKIYSLEMRRPMGSDSVQEKYIEQAFKRVKNFFDENFEFYQYYRSGRCHLDQYYFLHGTLDVRQDHDHFSFERDSKFSSNLDYKISKIIANDMVAVYLKKELKKLNGQCETEKPDNDPKKQKKTWTYSKTALTELIYALYIHGCINNGKIELKELSSYFSNMFNIELKDIYRTYQNIRSRKENRTQFIDLLRDCLINKMDEDDAPKMWL